MFTITTSNYFDRELKKLTTRHPEVRTLYVESLRILEVDPYNITHRYKIKKLVDEPICKGGQWRLTMGEWRLRYDIEDKIVRLRRIRNRKDAYQK